MVEVVAAVARRGDRFLVGLRPPHKRHGGLWEFPGGKLDPGETLPQAVARELEEELSVSVVGTGAVLLSIFDRDTGVRVHFLETQFMGTPSPLEHQELRWCSLPELLRLELAPADAAFVRQMLQ